MPGGAGRTTYRTEVNGVPVTVDSPMPGTKLGMAYLTEDRKGERLPKILILDEPTRGIDVGAKSEIDRLISAPISRKSSKA